MQIDAMTLNAMEISTWSTDAGDLDVLVDIPVVMVCGGSTRISPPRPGSRLRGSESPRTSSLTPSSPPPSTPAWRLHQISLQAAELRAAAKRIVAAQDEARRRIERDLHDGAQQRLVTLAVSLQVVSKRAASTGDETFAAMVVESREQLARALGELREMARGIHPAILTEEGLEAALAYLAERFPVPVHVQVALDRRLPPEVEATAYFVVSEALTNAAKHSRASKVAVAARPDDESLKIEVADNGRGGADERSGSGLQGLVDRLATLNGRLTIVSPEGGGTKLQAEIPCA